MNYVFSYNNIKSKFELYTCQYLAASNQIHLFIKTTQNDDSVQITQPQSSEEITNKAGKFTAYSSLHTATDLKL